MSGVKSVELSLRGAMLMKAASDLVGAGDVLVARLVVQNIKEKLRDLEKFLNTAEVEK